MRRTVRRIAILGAITTAFVTLSAGAASAHDAEVPEPSSFTSIFTSTTSPDVVVNSEGMPAPGPDDATGTRNYRLNSDMEIICYDITVSDRTTRSPGWYRNGGRPDLLGPTVLLGHVDSLDGPAVCYRLRDLAPGEVVEVTTAGGGVARYAVDRVEQVAKDEFPTFEVFGATRDDVLRVVTCAGEFDRGEHSLRGQSGGARVPDHLTARQDGVHGGRMSVR